MFKIYEGDSFIVLDELQDNSIDMSFTSPDPPSSVQDITQLVDIFKKIKQKTKDSGSLWVQIGDYHNNEGSMNLVPEIFVLMMKDRGWIVRSKLIWHRTEETKPEEYDRFVRNWEYLYFFTKTRNHFFNKNLGLQRTSVFSIPTDRVKSDKFRSAFPEKLIEISIKVATSHGHTVLDPFCGSGTTGVVALKNRRSFIGIEKRKENIPLIQQRLSKFDL